MLARYSSARFAELRSILTFSDVFSPISRAEFFAHIALHGHVHGIAGNAQGFG